MRLLVLCVSTLLSLFSSTMPSATASPTLTQGGSSSSSSSSSHAAENSTATTAPTTTTTTATTAITTATTTAPTGIVIVAQARSGSTVLGEIFRENEDVLYLYEPCRGRGSGLTGTYGSELVGSECFALARRICRCEFTLQDSDRLAQDGSALKAGSPVLKELRRAATDNNPTIEALIQAHQTVTDVCKKSKAVAIKSIRLRDELNGPDWDASGLKLLHLVRDPRAVVRSQLGTFGNKAAKKYDTTLHGWASLSSAAADERAHHVLAKQ
eukprot:jgi/Undpi1/7987/HiC_scaffold_24.g10459.m1